MAEIEYKCCFLAFLDICGFKEKVRKNKTKKDREQAAQLAKWMMDFSALKSGLKAVKPSGETYPFQARFFSDTAVLFMPKDEGNISQLLFLVRYLHDLAIINGFLLRGAVTIDEMFWDPKWSIGEEGESTITVGPGIIEAHELESEVAVYPRIILSERICEFVENSPINAEPFAVGSDGILAYFRRDFDGQHFLDVLHPKVQRPEGEALRQSSSGSSRTIEYRSDAKSGHARVVQLIRKAIEKECSRKKISPKVRAKYNWLQSYVDSQTQNLAQGERQRDDGMKG